MADAPNEAEQIATLVALTGVAPAQAVDLLQNAGGDLQLAINDYFIQMEGGDPNAAPPPGGGGDEDAMADDDGGGSHDDDDEDDDDFEDDAGGLLSPYSPQGQNALTPPPPPKRPKVEMRQPPKLSTAPDELKGQLQRVFGLTSAPVDAAEKLHRAVSDRMQSWAFGDERSLTYLLNCFGRLGAAFPTAAQAIANASGGTGGAVSPQIAQAEADCFPLAVLLHHARAILLSGEAHDDGLGLFQEGGASDSELSRILGSGQPHAPPFVTAIHRSMSEAELEQVYSTPLDDMLSKLASATIKINSGGGGGFGGFGGSSSSSNSGGGGGIDWRKALQEAETLLGLQWVSQPSRQLKALPQGEAIRRVLGKRMAEETSHLRSNRWCARDAETQGCLRLFSPSPPGVDVRSAASRGLKIGAIHHNDGSLMMGVQKEVAQMQSHLRQLLTTALIKDKETQPVLLAWMSAVLQANELHLKPPKDPQAMQQAVMKRAGDACMVNLAAVLLQLCEPFIEPSASKTGKGHNGYERFDVSWFDRELSRRVGNSKAVSMFKSHTLRRMLEAAGAAASGGEAPTKQEAVDVSDGATTAAAAEDELAQALRLSLASTTPSPVPTPPATVTSPAVTAATTTFPDFHFVTECFFLAMGAAHSGLLPALDKSERLLQDFHRKARIPPLPENANPNEYQSQLQAIQAAGLGPIQAAILGYKCLTDGEGLTNLHGRFAYLTTAWLTHIASLPKADETFTRLPEHAVTNACALVRNMAFTSPQALRMSPWAMPVVSRFLCEMLVRKDLISSPFVRYQFVDALHALAFIDEDMERRQRTSLMLSSNLFDLVDGKAAAAAQPALISLYVELGMHTNADAVTDKNQQRSWLMKVLGRLWLQPQGWAALQALAESDSFGEFATTLVKENIFLLDDALGRLTDVKKAEEEKADTDAWAKLTPRQQADREKRILSVRHTAQAFLGLGKLTLATLLRLATDSVIGKIFTDYPDRAKKMVAMLIKFLTTLTTNPSELNVKDRDKLGWKPRELLSDTTQLLLACYERSNDFLDKLKANDSFERGTVEHVYRILRDKCQKEFPPHKLEKLTTLLVKLGSSEGGEGEGSGSAAAGEGEKSVTENALMAMKAAEEKEGAKELLARVDGVYQAAMRPLAFGEAELSGAAAFGGGAGSSSSREGQYAHHYNTNIQENPSEGMARTKLKRLMRELGKLGQSGEDGEGALPVNAEASVFMVRDENRMDVLKCLISGPADVLGPSETPYAGGLFEFHVFIPPDYPQVSPLVNLQTTGDGTFRFNPNLYSDGKVCLSLLGTWHGEGWVVPTAGNANSGSTLLQVLVSIQSIIMVSKPYFNEPGYEASAGTPAGEERSRDYNENIRLHTMRHAMRDVLRRPPYGMESVVRKHFLLTRPLLERQLARWLDECKDGSRKKGMERAYVEIMDLLVKAEEEEKKAEGEGGGAEAMEIS